MEVGISVITDGDLVVGTAVAAARAADHEVEVDIAEDHHPHIDDDLHPRTPAVDRGPARPVWLTPYLVPIS